MPLPLTIGTGRSLLVQDRVQAFRSVLKRYATYAWWGPDATLTGWVDCVSGVNAASGGSGTTLGNLNGVPCPVFNGSGRYQTAAFASAISQPYAIVSVSRRTGDLSGFRCVHDGIASGNRAALLHNITTGEPIINAGNSYYTGSPIGTGAVVIKSTYSNTPEIAINGVVQSSGVGSVGTNTLTGLSIGVLWNASTAPFIGPILLVAIFDSSKLANATAVDAAARSLIGV